MQLPAERVSQEGFNKFREKHLDGLVLSTQALKSIDRLFAFGRKDTGHMSCDEYHQHRYRCIYFTNPVVGIVYRLVDEIQMYQEMVKDLKKTMEEANVPLPPRMKMYEDKI